MNNREEMILQIHPELIERASGGWLAVTPHGSILQIGVVGATENEARNMFSQTLEKWAAIFIKERSTELK